MREFCPLECAIKQMKETNRKVEELLHKYIDVEAENLNDLQMTMQGIIAPAVMGGIKNYEDAFFNGEYVPDDDSHKDGRGPRGKRKDHVTHEAGVMFDASEGDIIVIISFTEALHDSCDVCLVSVLYI